MDKKYYTLLMSVEDFANLNSEDALEHIGNLIDYSWDLQKTEGLKHAIKLVDKLHQRQLTTRQFDVLNYYLANAWANLRILLRGGKEKLWDWEQEELEKEIIHLRLALQGDDLQGLTREERCPIITNLGNTLNHIGRFIEAIECWDEVIKIDHSFAMAMGNRGIGLIHYASVLYDNGHQLILLKSAQKDLKNALSGELHEEARQGFNRHLEWLNSLALGKDVESYKYFLGSSKGEIQYRKWCLHNRLFLNPLNDLGPYPIGARDIFSTPPIVTGISQGPYYQGYFNQMKQEFVSARFLYYEGINDKQAHFSDKEVLLINTLDYPAYSLAIEKVKAAFKVAYSIFDKIAYFFNHYLGLSINEKKVSFRTLWYEMQSRQKGLRHDFRQRQNWPLRGLFWLSKDLYEDKQGFKQSIEPSAQELCKIRNHLEHKYLKLHNEFWVTSTVDNHEAVSLSIDKLAFSMDRYEFEEKTLRLLKMIRSALIYLSLAIHCEENQRAKERNADDIIPVMPLDIIEDGWKT